MYSTQMCVWINCGNHAIQQTNNHFGQNQIAISSKRSTVGQVKTLNPQYSTVSIVFWLTFGRNTLKSSVQTSLSLATDSSELA